MTGMILNDKANDSGRIQEHFEIRGKIDTKYHLTAILEKISGKKSIKSKKICNLL